MGISRESETSVLILNLEKGVPGFSAVPGGRGDAGKAEQEQRSHRSYSYVSVEPWQVSENGGDRAWEMLWGWSVATCIPVCRPSSAQDHVGGYARTGGEAKGARLCSQRCWLPCHHTTAGLVNRGYDPGTVRHGSQGILRMDVIGLREGGVILLLCVPEGHHNTIFRNWYV